MDRFAIALIVVALSIPYCYFAARVICHAYFRTKLWYHMTLTRMIKHGADHG